MNLEPLRGGEPSEQGQNIARQDAPPAEGRDSALEGCLAPGMGMALLVGGQSMANKIQHVQPG